MLNSLSQTKFQTLSLTVRSLFFIFFYYISIVFILYLFILICFFFQMRCTYLCMYRTSNLRIYTNLLHKYSLFPLNKIPNFSLNFMQNLLLTKTHTIKFRYQPKHYLIVDLPTCLTVQIILNIQDSTQLILVENVPATETILPSKINSRTETCDFRLRKNKTRYSLRIS